MTLSNLLITESDITGSNCYDYGESFTSTIINTTEAVADQLLNDGFDDNVSNALSDVGLVSTKSKMILGLVMILVITVGVFLKTKSIPISLSVSVGATLLCFTIGLISVFPMIIMILVSVTMLTVSLLTIFRGGGGA